MAALTARPFLRQLHIYFSFFVAPCLIFFAVTGAFQTFRIPDQKTAPLLLQKLARVHKDDIFAPKPPSPPRNATRHTAGAKSAPRPQPALSTVLVKWFFVADAALIVITTLMGLWMGLAYSRDRKFLWLLLFVGSAVPVVLLAL